MLHGYIYGLVFSLAFVMIAQIILYLCGIRLEGQHDYKLTPAMARYVERNAISTEQFADYENAGDDSAESVLKKFGVLAQVKKKQRRNLEQEQEPGAEDEEVTAA